MFISNKDLEVLLNDLWNADFNKCIPEKDYSLNLQGRLRSTTPGKDLAATSLFARFDEKNIFLRPTFRLFRSLLDNYSMETGVEEVVTKEEIQENNEFINEIVNTEVMKLLHKFLSARKLASPDMNQFKKDLNKIWFEMYRRSNVQDSCGFEHVFVGEIRDNQIIGLHNWIQIYLLEKSGNIDYKGYFEVGTSNESASPRVVTIQFAWKGGQTKCLGTSFIGTSPEFEIAFFTALHLCNVEGEIQVQVGGYHIKVNHHRIAGDKIGTSFIKGLD